MLTFHTCVSLFIYRDANLRVVVGFVSFEKSALAFNGILARIQSMQNSSIFNSRIQECCSLVKLYLLRGILCYKNYSTVIA